MTAAEITDALRLLRIPQTALAVWLDMDPRSVRRFCNDGAESGRSVKPVDVHPALALLVRLMLARPELREVVEGIAGPIR
jgi:hypothetical protein